MYRYVIAALAALAVAAPAQAATPQQREAAARAAIVDLDQHFVHGWRDANLSYTQLEANLAAGQTVDVACGTIATLAARRLVRLGVPARVVQGVTLHAVPADEDSGHILMEAYLGHRWQVFDLDQYVQPTDAHGQPVTIEQLVKMVQTRAPVRFKQISAPRPVDWASITPGVDVAAVHRELDHGVLSFYRTYLQASFLDSPAGLVYTGSPQLRAIVARVYPDSFNHAIWMSTADYRKTALPSFFRADIVNL